MPVYCFVQTDNLTLMNRSKILQIDQFELQPEDPGFKNNLDIINPI